MKAEIIMIGTELLLGQIVDTNASFLARHLAEIGFNLYHKTTVGDNDARIADAIRSALKRSDVVITSGGLGPTVDDKTRDAVAMATDRQLVLVEELLEDIIAFFKKRGLELGENNPRQAYIPQDAIPIRNPVGTAPGFIVKSDEKYVISLPGVPHELHHLTEKSLKPFLLKAFGIDTVIKTRILKTSGVGESNIDRLISDLEESENPTVGLAAHLGSVDIRIAARAQSNADADMLLDQMESKLREKLGDMIFGADEDTIEGVVIRQLADHNWRLAIFETNTGGELACRLTSIPGGFTVLSRAVCAGVNRLADIFGRDIGNQSSLSSETAEALAEKVRRDFGADVGISLIGDEDPKVGPYSKQAGQTFLGVSIADHRASSRIQLGGISRYARIRITSIALDFLRRYLLKYPT